MLSAWSGSCKVGRPLEDRDSSWDGSKPVRNEFRFEASLFALRLAGARNGHKITLRVCTRLPRMDRMTGYRLSERLRESIEEEIATGKLLPGTRLDEVELATRFGVSRTPIREALRLLLGEGLVETRPQRGAVVAQVTPQRLIEMFEVMAELEAMCARLAARRIDRKSVV